MLVIFFTLTLAGLDVGVPPRVDEPVYGIWVSPQKTTWAVGTFGVARDGGEGFQQIRTPKGFRPSSVWGTSDDDVWISDGGSPRVLHGGRAGFAITTPLNGSGVGLFTGSSNDVWAVHPGARSARLLHFDGSAWRIVHHIEQGHMRSIVSVRLNAVWLVVEADGPGAQLTELLECTVTSCTGLKMTELVAVFGAHDDIWVASRDGTLGRFDGKTWQTVAVPDAVKKLGLSLTTAAYVKRDDVWFAGARGIAQWNGVRWTSREVVLGEIKAVARRDDSLLVVVRNGAQQNLVAVPDGGTTPVKLEVPVHK